MERRGEAEYSTSSTRSVDASMPVGALWLDSRHLSSSFRPQATHNVALPRSVDTSVVNYLSLKSLTHAATATTTTTAAATPSTIMYLH